MEELKFKSRFDCLSTIPFCLPVISLSLEKKASMEMLPNSGKHMPLFYMGKYITFRESILHLVLHLQQMAIEFDLGPPASGTKSCHRKTVIGRIERINMLD